MAGGRQAELACGSRIEQPGLKHAVLDNGERPARDAFAVEWTRAQAAPPQRIIDHADTAPEQPLAVPVFQEACLARDCSTIDGAGQMTDQRACDAAVEHNRDTLGIDLARVEPRDRALCGGAS